MFSMKTALFIEMCCNSGHSLLMQLLNLQFVFK